NSFTMPREESQDYHVCCQVQVIEDFAALCNRHLYHLKRKIAPGRFDKPEPVNKFADKFPLICPTMYLFCLGDEQRAVTFSHPGHLRRHVRNTHLRYCKMWMPHSLVPIQHVKRIKGVMHFRNYVA